MIAKVMKKSFKLGNNKKNKIKDFEEIINPHPGDDN